MIIDRNYDYYEDERLYSTGDDELDDLLEKAFCEGYDYAQREFSFKDELRKASVKNVGIFDKNSIKAPKGFGDKLRKAPVTNAGIFD